MCLVSAQDPIRTYVFEELPICYYEAFDQGWQDKAGQTYALPIECEGCQSLTLHHTFEIGEDWPTDLMLWVDRIAWEAEILLNNQYLELHQDPFGSLVLPIDTAWLSLGTNTLTVTLRRGAPFAHAPQSVLGIWGEAGLVQRSDMRDKEVQIHKQVATAGDTVAVIAPYFAQADNPYVFDPFYAMRIFLPVLNEQISYIYYAYPPDRQLSQLGAMLGLTVVDSMAPDAVGCLINTYPLASSEQTQAPTFWLDAEGRRSVYYGDYRRWDERGNVLQPDYEPNWLLALMVLFPLLGAFVIKGTNSNFFKSFSSMLFQPKRFVDVSMDVSLSTGLLSFIYVLIKGGIQACWFALGMYFIQESQQWNWMENLLGNNSLLLYYLPGDDSLSILFLKGTLVAVSWQTIKFLVLGTIGNVFGLKGFARKAAALDLIGSLPLIFVLAVPFAVGLFWGNYAVVFNVLAAAFLWIYLLRKVYVLYMGLDRSFGFSVRLKILYICTFNILPYLLWV